jgi:hypothetical protein
MLLYLKIKKNPQGMQEKSNQFLRKRITKSGFVVQFRTGYRGLDKEKLCEKSIITASLSLEVSQGFPKYLQQGGRSFTAFRDHSSENNPRTYVKQLHCNITMFIYISRFKNLTGPCEIYILL